MSTKPLIIISSRTGNTMAVGHAVCDALPGAVMVKPGAVPEDLTPYNPILLGFWCDRGDAPEDMLAVAPRIHGKTIGCFATMGGDAEGERAKAWMRQTSEKLVNMGEGNHLAETFLCRGRIDPEVFQRMIAQRPYLRASLVAAGKRDTKHQNSLARKKKTTQSPLKVSWL